MTRALVAIALWVACSGPRPRTSRGESVESRCEQNARDSFRHCPHWRMAMPDACDSSTQPSFMDPCRCMCDLCESDADCAGGHCLAIASAMFGGYEQKTCVHAGETCFPDGHCPGTQVCRNYDGKATCEMPPPPEP